MTGGSGPKRIGSAFERAVVAYLRGQGFPAERAYGTGRGDRGQVLRAGALLTPPVRRFFALAFLRRRAWRSHDRPPPQGAQDR